METKYGVRKIITVICVTYVQKDFQIRNLIKQLLKKNLNDLKKLKVVSPSCRGSKSKWVYI